MGWEVEEGRDERLGGCECEGEEVGVLVGPIDQLRPRY